MCESGPGTLEHILAGCSAQWCMCTRRHNQVFAVLNKRLLRAVSSEKSNDNGKRHYEKLEPEFRTKSPGRVARRRHDGDDERCPRALVFVKSKHTQEELASNDDEVWTPAHSAMVIAQLGPSALLLDPVGE